MTFEEILNQAIAMLERQGRVSYRALKRQFDLDDDYLADLKAEIVDVHQVAVDQDGTMLVWIGDTQATPLAPVPPQPTGTHAGQLAEDHPQQTTPTPNAERRQLTVMFCDLVNSTVLSSQLDPEDYREVVRAYQATGAGVIQRFDGYIAQHLGDALLVYFGWPRAHEDDAQRAVRTGLGILEAMQELNARLEREKGVRLHVRIGMHTGLVVVGQMGSGDRLEHLAMGETPNVASRLQGLAESDTVLISAATYRLIQDAFLCQDLGTHALKGVTDPVQVYCVIDVNTVQSRLEGTGRTSITPLVGRESEMTLLRERWRQSQDGMGQVVLLSGEAGIGKSRLVTALREHVAIEGAPRITFRCSPYHMHTAFYPVIAHLERLLHFDRDDTSETKLHKLERGLQAYNVAPAQVVPLLAALLSVPLLERYPAVRLSPQQQRQQTLEALITWLLDEAKRQPILVVWEDLHWADPSTLEFLNLVIDQAPTARMFTLLLFRPEFHPTWTMHSNFTQLVLNRLNRAQVEAMVRHLAGGKALPIEIIEQIVAKTDGVPLFVEELVKMLVESTLLQEEDTRYVLTGPLPPLAIPATLQDSLMARLDRLGSAREVAQLGAVLGREFAYEVMQAVSALDASALQHELKQLVDAELLYHRGLPPHSHYRFKHALIQDAAYQSLLKRTRQQYHQQIVQLLETRFIETVETQPELLAHHAFQAEAWEKSVVYFRRAGTRALTHSAYQEAASHFEQALVALRHLPDSRDKSEQAIDLRLELRTAILPFGAYERMLQLLYEAEPLAEVLDDRHRLGWISLYMTIQFQLNTLDLDRSVACGQRALALGTAEGDIGLQAVANTYLGMAYHFQGTYHQAIDLFRQTIMSLEDGLLHERFGQAALPSVAAHASLAWSLAETGTFTEGLSIGKEGLRIAESVEQPFSMVFAFIRLGMAYFRNGAMEKAIATFERGLELCHVANILQYVPCFVSMLAAGYALTGRVTEVLPLLESAVKQTTSMIQAFYSLAVTQLSEASLCVGHVEKAHDLALRAYDFSQPHKERGMQAWVMRLLGDIAMHHDPPDTAKAETHYQQALALAEELGMRPLVAHCHRGLGTLYATIGQPDLARTELSTAIDLYRTMDMTFWLPQTEAVLAQIGGTSLSDTRIRE